MRMRTASERVLRCEDQGIARSSLPAAVHNAAFNPNGTLIVQINKTKSTLIAIWMPSNENRLYASSECVMGRLRESEAELESSFRFIRLIIRQSASIKNLFRNSEKHSTTIPRWNPDVLHRSISLAFTTRATWFIFISFAQRARAGWSWAQLNASVSGSRREKWDAEFISATL